MSVWTIIGWILGYLLLGTVITSVVYTVAAALKSDLVHDDECKVLLTLFWPVAGLMGSIVGIVWVALEIGDMLIDLQRLALEKLIAKIKAKTACRCP